MLTPANVNETDVPMIMTLLAFFIEGYVHVRWNSSISVNEEGGGPGDRLKWYLISHLNYFISIASIIVQIFLDEIFTIQRMNDY